MTIETGESGKYSSLIIKDTGIGMQVEEAGRIFEPFYTTKSANEGTGIGLNIVKEIVEDYKGTIKVQSEKGVGTKFEVKLPTISPEHHSDNSRVDNKF